jgi:hypothetical protein
MVYTKKKTVGDTKHKGHESEEKIMALVNV